MDKQRLRFGGLVRLIRPLNFLMFFAGVALGGTLAVGLEAFSSANVPRIILAMVSAALIGGGANAINDVYDMEIDVVNRPDRPLPSGDVHPEMARRVWLGLSFIGVAIGWVISPAHGLMACGSVLLLWAYSAHLKRQAVWGNLAVALVLALAIFYGGLVPASGDLGAVLIGALFALLVTLAREGAKDIEDLEGDALHSARTLPILRGPRFAARVVLLLIAVTLLLVPVPAIVGFGVAFLGFAIPAALGLLAAGWSLLAAGASNTEQTWRSGAGTASARLKLVMAAGIVALALARIG